MLRAACRAFDLDIGRATECATLVRDFYEKDARSAAHRLAYFEGSELIDLFEAWSERCLGQSILGLKFSQNWSMTSSTVAKSAITCA